MPRRGPLLVPTLQAVCGDRFPLPLTYGQPLAGGRAVEREVDLGRGRTGKVIGRTTPLRPTFAALNRGRPTELCMPGYLVEVNGRTLPANARRVRETNRTPRDPCPLHVAYHPSDVRAALREAARLVEAGELGHAREFEGLGDLPFPHHARSGPCCASSENTPEAVLEQFEPWVDGDEAARQVELARRAIPRTLRGEVRVEQVDDIPPAMRAVQDHCLAVTESWVDRAEVPRAEKWREVKASVRRGYDWKGSRKAR